MIRPFSKTASLSFLLALSFCCSPATKNPPPPVPATDSNEQVENDIAPPPVGIPNDRSRYAAPPPGTASDLPERQQWAETKGKKSTQNSAPQYDPPAPRAMEARDSEPAMKADKAEANRGSGAGDDRSGYGALAKQAPPSTSTVRPSPPVQEERPGLGTTWGETRYSHVDEVPFVRASSAPTFSATLWYNDRQGANAMAQNDPGYVGYNRAAALALGRAVTMTLRNEYGSPLAAVYSNGRTHAIGEAGQRYVISLQNNTPDRFEVVLSVDGLDVLDGRSASTGKRGYLLDGYASIDVEGFRQSDDHVAAFRFGSVRDSYAARTGGGRNVGVIGCAAFAERGYYSYREIERRHQADPFPNKWASPPIYMVR
ncbi:MAG: hypothetical protein IT381_23910 [Deltaproteobacteria bacterium]|nr:hypothetical protein [Deltaproteobacteria bacterium]